MQKIITVLSCWMVALLVSGITFSAYAQPANDNCLGATVLVQDGGCVASTVEEATFSQAAVNCGGFTGNPNDDVWFVFVAQTENPTIAITETGGATPFDGVLELFSGTCGDLTSIDCDDFNESINAFGLTVGNTYYVRYYSFSGGPPTTPEFEICLTGTIVPPCGDEAVTAPGNFTGNTAGAGNDCALRVSEDYLYTVTIPNDGQWTFSLCGSSYDTYLYLGTICCTGDIAENDQFNCGGSFNQSSITADLTAGIYFVAVEGWTETQVGSFTLDIFEVLPPANDDCENAIVITQNESCITTAGTVAAGSGSGVATCSGTDNDDVWYSFEATNEEAVIIVDATFNSVVELLSGDCSTPSSLACANLNTFTGVESLTYGDLTVGEDYFVRVHSSSFNASGTNTFSLCVYTFNCNETTVTAPGTFTGTTLGAGNSCFLRPSEDATYEVVVPNDGIWTFSLCGSTYDTFLYLGTDCCSGDLASNDQFGCPDGSFNQSSITQNITAGTYFVTIEGWQPTLAGDYTLTIVEQEPLPNDECEGAISLTQTEVCSPTSGTVQGATDSGLAGGSCFFGAVDDDVWYSFEATEGSAIIEITTGFSSVIEVFSGNCDGTLTSIACGAFTNQLTVGSLTVGETYYVRIFSYFTGPQFSSTFTICVRNAPDPPANDNCANATPITQNATCVETASTLAGATDSGVPGTICDGFAQTPNDDVWFSFVATSANPTVDMSNNNFDAVIELFSGECGTLTSIGCGDLPVESVFASGLTIGETYYVRVFSYSTIAPITPTFSVCVFDAASATRQR